MKKRILAVLLMVVILAALFVGLSVTAAAENDISGDTISGYVVAYTLKKDDTVLKVCNNLGIDFYKNQALITKINNIGDYSKLPVGKVVWLPATSVGSAKDYYTLKTHKVVSGDNVNTLLTKYGIASTDTMLSRVNNNLAAPTVGSTVTFPVYTGDTTAKMADATAVTIGGTAAAATATGLATTTTGTTTLASGNVAYYLMAYTMQPGDTVGAVCTANGISFNQHSALITRINGITNYNRIPVGRTIVLPTATSTGATYSVVAHQIKGGETANDICSSYGTSLAANLTLVKGLNNTNNLNYIQAGGILYVPVAGAAGTAGGTATGIAGGTAGGTTGGTTGGSTATSGNIYKLTKDSTSNGSFVLKVDGKETDATTAGQTVTIVSTGKGNYVQKTVVAYLTGDKTKVVTVTNNTFVMPEFNVSVDVTFGKATNYALKCTPSTNGAYEVYVDDSLVSTQTYGGAIVTVKPKPASGYMLDTIKVYKTGDDTKTTKVTDNKFTMPAYDTTIEVTFKPSTGYEYDLNIVLAKDCTVEFKVGNNVVNKAKSGDTVKVVGKPTNDSFVLDRIRISYYVWNSEKEKEEYKEDVVVSNQQFTMPTFNDNLALTYRHVDVKVEYIRNWWYSVTINTDAKGNTVVAHCDTIDGVQPQGREHPGRVVVLVPNAKAGYEIDTITVVKKSDNSTIKSFTAASLTSDASFVMPYSDIVIKSTFKAATAHKINFTITPDNSWGSATFKANSTLLTGTPPTAMPGVTVNMEIKPVNDVVRLKPGSSSIKCTYKYNGKDVAVNVSGNNFVMPAYDVSITAEFEVVKPQITTATNAYVDHVDYTVNSQPLTSPYRVAIGDNVVINPVMKSGYDVKEIKVTYVDSKGKTQEVPVNNNVFVMPAYDATVTITEETSTGSFAIVVVDTTGGTAKVVDKNNPSITMTRANKDVELKVVAEPSTYYEIEKITWKKETWASAADITSDPTFKMPECNVEVTVTFKAQTFALSKISVDPTIGDIKITDNDGHEIDHAQYNDPVKVIATVQKGYKLGSVGAKNKDTNVVFATGDSFTMPAFDVEVFAEFVPLKKDLALTAADTENGKVKFQVNGADVDKADEDASVSVVAYDMNSGYIVDTITAVTASGKSVTVTGNKFTMPDEAVTVTVTFKLG